jgi:FMN phosphatase YigB (HAD superfamily)
MVHRFLETLHEKGYKRIIFDFDETICTLNIDWYSWSNTITGFIRTYDPEFSGALSHTRLNDAMRKLGPEFKEKLTNVNIKAEREEYHGYDRDEEMIEFVKEAAKEFTIHLWTTNCLETVTPVLTEVGLDDVFTNSAFFNNVPLIKPDPAGFKIISQDESNKGEFIFIGDSNSDEGAASALGIPFYHVNEVKR